MHPSVMDVALRVAVAYPVLLLILPWIVSYSDATRRSNAFTSNPFLASTSIKCSPDCDQLFCLVFLPLLYFRKGGFENYTHIGAVPVAVVIVVVVVSR